MREIWILVFLAGLYSASLALAGDVGPAGPKGPDASPAATATKTPVDLPYKPGAASSASDSAAPGKKAKAVSSPPANTVLLTVVDVAIPFIPSKSPDPVGAPDP